MKNLKWSSPVTGIIIVIILLAGYFLYQKQTYAPKPFSQETAQPSPSVSNDQTINDEDNTPSQVKSITILSTNGWKEVSLEGVSFKIPSEGRFQSGGYSGREQMGAVWGLVYFNKNDVVSSKISVEKYNGGSRREQFLAPFGANRERIIEDCKLKFEEALFGNVKALQIPHGDSSCPSGIVTVVGDKLIIFHDLFYDANTGAIYRIPEIDTVVSTLR